MLAETNIAFEATAVGAPTGLVGQITVQIYDPSNADVIVAPTTAGITEPATGTYRVVLTSPSAGTYAIRWELPGGGVAEEELIVTDFPVADPSDLMPDVDDVAALLRARTKDANGNELGTFTALTRPTDDGVEDLITTAYGDVTAQVGTHLPLRTVSAARSMIALRAACLVELSYFPEQVRSDRSAYEHYWRMYEEGMVALGAAVDDGATGDDGVIAPRFGVLNVIGQTAAGQAGPFAPGNLAQYPYTAEP